MTPLRRLVAAICAIVAIALAAATVRSPLETGSDGSGGGGDDGTSQQPPPEQPPDGGVPPFLEWLLYVLVVLLAVVLVWYLLAHRRDAVKLLAVMLVLGLVVFAVVYGLLESGLVAGGEMEPAEPLSGEGDGESSGDGDGTDSGDDGTVSAPESVLALLAVLTAVVLGGLFLSRRSTADETGGAERSPDTADSESDAETVAAVGTAAGEAADRIEGGDEFENAVYRAWREMTRPLEVERPDSSTPREFASAAVDAGMDRDDVDELTELFEAVRYGNAPTTSDREERAVAVLERIETEYAEISGPESNHTASTTSADATDSDGGEQR